MTKRLQNKKSLTEIVNSGLFHVASVMVWLAAGVIINELSHAAVLTAVGPAIILGYIFGLRLARSELRTVFAVLMALAFFALMTFLSRAALNSVAFAKFLGTHGAFTVSESMFWGSMFFSALLIFRCLVRRSNWTAALELVTLALVATYPLRAHRGGYINRPVELIDKALIYGFDPTAVFLAVGFVAVLFLFFILLNRKKNKKSVLDFLIYAAILLLLFALAPYKEITSVIAQRGGGGLGGEEQTQSESDSTGTKFEQKRGGSRENDQTRMANSQGKPSDRPVAAVNFLDEYSPPNEVYYFRQSTFSRFNGVRLVKDNELGADQNPLDLAALEKDREEEFYKPYSKYVETDVALLREHSELFGLADPVYYEPLQNNAPDQFRKIYRVGSLAQSAPFKRIIINELYSSDSDLETEPLTPEEWELYTEIPEDPRYEELAEEIVSEVYYRFRNNRVARALAVKLWLDENSIYSMSCDHSGADDPTGSFLFGDLTGYCVYTTHAAVYLFRSLGIPARAAGGYAVNQRSVGGGSTVLILGKNAHLWPEIFVDGIGWLIFDIAPARSLDPPDIANNQSLQQLMGDMMRENSQPLPKQSLKEDLAEALQNNPAKKVLSSIPYGLLILLILAYFVKIYRRVRAKFASGSNLLRLAYVEALEVLVESGFRRPKGVTHSRFAENLRNDFSSFYRLSRRRHRDYFRDNKSVLISKNEILGELKSAEREIAAKTPIWKRIIGIINPVSWLSVK